MQAEWISGNIFIRSNELPKVGDKVYFAKYAGLVIKADDKSDYRMMNDKDVTAVLV